MERGLTKKQKKWLRRIILGAVGFVILEVLHSIGAFDGGRWWLGFLTALVPYLIVGWDVICKSVRNIMHGEVFDENFLMMIATFGAFGIGEYPEAVAVMLLYQIGELFQNYATGRSRDSISQLMSLAPETAVVERGGETMEVDPDEVEMGEIIIVRPGEKIPLDGVVTEGSSMIDTSALTGEPVPRSVKPGENVISGCVNGKGTLKIRTTKCYEDSTVAKILELVENATDKKTRVENFVTRFARVYTPIVTVGALILAVIPPLILGGGAQVWISWIRRACIFLVVSCPCALVISVPLGFFGGIGAASRAGVLVKGSNYLEVLAGVKTFVFDKTGTLTRGEFKVSSVIPAENPELWGSISNSVQSGMPSSVRNGMSSSMQSGMPSSVQSGMPSSEQSRVLLEMAAYAEMYSTHPVAESIRAAYEEAADGGRIDAGQPEGVDIVKSGLVNPAGTGKEAAKPGRMDPSRVSGCEEIAGHGVIAQVDGRQILAGNEKLMREHGIQVPGGMPAVTVVYIACGGTFAGAIVISDTLKDGVAEAMRSLKAKGVKKTVMLTGDNETAARHIAEEAGVDKVFAQLLPADKVERVEQLMKEESGRGGIAFVGDGINDAPVLMRADVGIAMGMIGSDAAIEAADIVLMDDDVRKIPRTVEIARKTMVIIHTNILFAIAVKIAILGMGAFGIANMWMAIFGDVGVLIICILNAMRLLRYRGRFLV